jgi:hypothetical protein
LQAWKTFSISHAVSWRFDAFRDDLDFELLCDADEASARIPWNHRTDFAANPGYP